MRKSILSLVLSPLAFVLKLISGEAEEAAGSSVAKGVRLTEGGLRYFLAGVGGDGE